MADRYWIGDSGDWTDTNHWSDTDGGTGGVSIPTSADDTYFTVNSFSTSTQSVTITGKSDCICGSMDWSEVTNTPTLVFVDPGPSILSVYGNITFSSNMNIDKPTLTLTSLYSVATSMSTLIGILICGDCHLTSNNLDLPTIVQYEKGYTDDPLILQANLISLYLEDDFHNEGILITSCFDSQEHNITTTGIMFLPCINNVLIDIGNSNIFCSGFVLFQIPSNELGITSLNILSNFLANITILPFEEGVIDIDFILTSPIIMMMVFNPIIINTITISSSATQIFTPVISYVFSPLSVNYFYSNGIEGNNNIITTVDISGVLGGGDDEPQIMPWYIKCNNDVDITNTTLIYSGALGDYTYNAFTSNGCVDGGNNNGWYFGPPETLYLEDDLTCAHLIVTENLNTQTYGISSTGITIQPLRESVNINIEDSNFSCYILKVDDPNNNIEPDSNFLADVTIKEVIVDGKGDTYRSGIGIGVEDEGGA